MATKSFHLGDILSITTGRLVSPRHTDGVYDILNFMTGDNLFTHQLGRASDECKPYLLDQFPLLKGIDASAVSGENWQKWLSEQVKKYGEHHDVRPMPMDDHDAIDPLDELKEMLDGDDSWIIVVNIGG